MGRLPKTDDFPDSVKLNIVPPPKNDPPTNILLLLHGLGDTAAPFTVLGGQLNLPETCCFSLQGPATLLDLEGFHWGDDIIFDSTNGGLDSDAGFNKTNEILKSVVQDVLVGKCGYREREVLILGFGQGGMAALNYAATHTPSELSGIISIGSGLPSSAPASLTPKLPTPVLICAGASQSAVTSSSEDKLKRVFEHVEIKRYRRPGDSMPSNRDEMLPVMRFLSRRLRSMKGVPDGTVEIN
ncbi:hypothetical protein M409DRAFT_23548 [Zasmidium cellare ATCC 36951]|uniref:Phospholipase/carboxylesterase/thioesterase domain-containing protein n=1 Tax=Zasmidium cellare ATCC 36951 TaxID=1080233 RepID=A0A6A6CGI4_ZASCE|nr:uncharacterized protein M409DRAFT_23548 [Zasmidium cellare ATCC 36951]KAF2166357.1 hypothetical protein M409DRAFT_23548 [Zasmidium cellare ATCC 36951]